MKQAKASQKEIDDLCEFLHMIEEVLTCGTYTYDIDGVETTETVGLDRFKEIIEQLWVGDWIGRESGVGVSWYRIVFGYITLVDNACDPDSKFLEWKKEIAEHLNTKT